MFNQRSDVALEGPNPFVRKIGNRFFHKDQIPRALKFNDQRRDREVLDNLRAQGVPVGPIVPLADPKNVNHVGKKGGANQKKLSAEQGPIVPAQYVGGYEQQYQGNPFVQPNAATVTGSPVGQYPGYGYAAASPYGYNTAPIGSPLGLGGGSFYSPTVVGGPGFGGYGAQSFGAPGFGALY